LHTFGRLYACMWVSGYSYTYPYYMRVLHTAILGLLFFVYAYNCCTAQLYTIILQYIYRYQVSVYKYHQYFENPPLFWKHSFHVIIRCHFNTNLPGKKYFYRYHYWSFVIFFFEDILYINNFRFRNRTLFGVFHSIKIKLWTNSSLVIYKCISISILSLDEWDRVVHAKYCPHSHLNFKYYYNDKKY